MKGYTHGHIDELDKVEGNEHADNDGFRAMGLYWMVWDRDGAPIAVCFTELDAQVVASALNTIADEE